MPKTRLQRLGCGRTSRTRERLHSLRDEPIAREGVSTTAPRLLVDVRGFLVKPTIVQHQTKLLPGTRILVTRSPAQAMSLCQVVQRAGGVPLHFPVFEIVPTLDPVAPKELQQVDILIFTSPNAVSFFPKTYLDELRLSTMRSRTLFAMGPSTQKALELRGLTVAEEPKPPFNSEALLGLPSLQAVHQKKILVVTGKGGRMYLTEILQKRGAQASCIEVYARRETEGDLLAFWKEYNPEIILTTSNEILQAIYDRMKDKPILLKTPLIVTSKRAMLLAEQLEFKVILAIPFYDEAKIIETIAEYIEWQTTKKQRSK